MFSGQVGLNYSFNLSDGQELVDTAAGMAKLSPTGFVVLSVVLGFIMTFGFLNNFIVLLLFCKFKKLRTPVNMLLLNISVSDMMVCLFGTPLSFASSVRGKWLLGRSGCSWYGFINSCFGKFPFNGESTSIQANTLKIVVAGTFKMTAELSWTYTHHINTSEMDHWDELSGTFYS